MQNLTEKNINFNFDNIISESKKHLDEHVLNNFIYFQRQIDISNMDFNQAIDDDQDGKSFLITNLRFQRKKEEE